MKIGIKFSRLGFSKYISHLDMQRLFHRSIRRAGIPARYSQGFNPHMNMSFASPLPVGMETRGDYLEFYTTENIGIPDALERLNETIPEGFRVMKMGELEEAAGKLMALTVQAEYELQCEQAFLGEWLSHIMQKDSYMLTRVRKGKTRTFDIRPLIHAYVPEENRLTLRLENSGAGSLSPLFLLQEASKSAGEKQTARVIRTDLYMLGDTGTRKLEKLFR